MLGLHMQFYSITIYLFFQIFKTKKVKTIFIAVCYFYDNVMQYNIWNPRQEMHPFLTIDKR